MVDLADLESSICNIRGKKPSSHCICGLPANTLKSELMGRCYYASPVPVATAVGLKKHCNGLCD